MESNILSEKAITSLELLNFKVITSTANPPSLQLRVSEEYCQWVGWVTCFDVTFKPNEWVINLVYRLDKDTDFYSNEAIKFLYSKALVYSSFQISSPRTIIINNICEDASKKHLLDKGATNDFFLKTPIGKFIRRVLSDFSLQIKDSEVGSFVSKNTDLKLTFDE
ncbi:hypothetical protein [Endozoicomonas numazuensis]|uniref:Uncharacterized protein n=1 Tax=Endozoicomonas numazuensis TaxID=1137799 RepID=A0A081NGH4_9GAMM|nr:hypothetical protein [Endozoicomonas numazuensis]KEQ17547.1 hypothetical protein GZ78_17535 [Endozoicomonas numazuensis]